MPISGPGSPWSRRGGLYVPGASGPAGTPTTYEFTSLGSDGYMSGSPGAADGSGTTVFTGDIYVGQDASVAYEGFIAFDTSTAAGTITAATLSFHGGGVADGSATDFTLEARPYDFGATLTTADWRSRASLSALPLVASRSTVGWSTSAFNVLTSEAAFLSNINQSGISYFVLCSSRHRNANAASGNEYVGFKSFDTGGTPTGPKLVIESLV